MIKHLFFIAAMMLIGASCASADPKADLSDKTLTPDTPIDQTLDALDQVGQGLKDFDAKVILTSSDNIGSEEKHIGHVWFQARDGDNARVHVVFDRTVIGKQIRDQKKEYLLADGWLTTRDYSARGGDENKTQVLKPGQKINLLKLGQGPFPLPIGQKKQDVLAQFDVSKVAPSKDDPAHSVHLQLTPRKDSSFARKFKSLDFWIDATTHMPTRIQTLDKSESTLQTTDFSDLRRNSGLKDSDFDLPDTKGDWNKTVQPME